MLLDCEADMPRLKPKVKNLLEKSTEAAILAVDVYNKPATKFRSYGYIVLMVIAWTSLFHAIFEKGREPYYYKEKKDKRKYLIVDGEKKAWELSECLNGYFKELTSPVRSNLELMIGVRNKIEHRFLPALDNEIMGECHAMLLNYENLLIREFGRDYSLSTSLAIPLQLMSVDPTWQANALKQLQANEYQIVREYIHAFRDGLREDIRNSHEYSLRVYLVPKLANKPGSSDLAIEFVKYDPSDPEAMKQYEQVVALIKDKRVLVPVTNLGMLKAGDVCWKVEQALQVSFHPSGQHSKCWKYYEIRPGTRATNPELTVEKYCRYDAPHRDYVYSEEWVGFLIQELADSDKQMAIFGKHLKPLRVPPPNRFSLRSR